MALDDIYQLLVFPDGLGTAGQPTREQFADIAAAGYDLVINLAVPTSTGAIANEEQIVRGHGMEYLAIPVVWEEPTRHDLLRFFEAMDANQGRKIFLHCAANMRVSAFLFLYRVLKQDIPESEAERDLHRIWKPSAWWDTFIEDNLEIGLTP